VTNWGGHSGPDRSAPLHPKDIGSDAPNPRRIVGEASKTEPAQTAEAERRRRKYEKSFANFPKLFYLCSIDAMKEKADVAYRRNRSARRPSRPIGRGAARQAKAKRETAGKWRRNGLKRLNPRPEMVVSPKSRTYKIWYSGARLSVRDSG